MSESKIVLRIKMFSQSISGNAQKELFSIKMVIFIVFAIKSFSCNQIRKCPKPTTFWILNFIIERSVPMKSISFQWKRAAWESDGIASGARNLIKPIENYGSLTFQQYETKLKSQEH